MYKYLPRRSSITSFLHYRAILTSYHSKTNSLSLDVRSGKKAKGAVYSLPIWKGIHLKDHVLVEK
jgi:hypothetical protein